MSFILVTTNGRKITAAKSLSHQVCFSPKFKDYNRQQHSTSARLAPHATTGKPLATPNTERTLAYVVRNVTERKRVVVSKKSSSLSLVYEHDRKDSPFDDFNKKIKKPGPVYKKTHI